MHRESDAAMDLERMIIGRGTSNAVALCAVRHLGSMQDLGGGAG